MIVGYNNVLFVVNGIFSIMLDVLLPGVPLSLLKSVDLPTK